MKRLLPAFASLLSLTAAAGAGTPVECPQQSIHMVVSFGPGGGADIVGRILADALQNRLGKPVVVENKPGAGGMLGDALVANARPDGCTIGLLTAGQIVAEVMRKGSSTNFPRTLTPLSHIASANLMIATRNDFPANNVNELVAIARTNPGRIILAIPSFGATQHFAGELFQQAAGIELLEVPFRSSPDAISAVLGKHADVMFDTVSALIGHVSSGSLKPLAVTSKERSSAVPDVPAASESGLLRDYDVTTWYGVFGPPGMPAPLVAKMNVTLNEIINERPVRAHLVAAGVSVRGSTTAEFENFIQAEYIRWNAVRQAAGIAQQ